MNCFTKRFITIFLVLFLVVFEAMGQADNKIRVLGTVKDTLGEPIVAATVAVKGTTQGVVTDLDGNFMLSVSPKATLVFTYLGYKTQEVKIEGQTSLDVVMEESTLALQEVEVTVGYASQRKISVLGAQSGVQVEDLKQPVANLTNVIAGRISGVTGVQRSGEPGNDNADIWIRGISTFSNSTPLILVDGVERAFGNIDPEDIESFQILKDASATAVYGVKGANGVIIITTKQGKKGKPRVRFEYNYGIKNFTKVPEIADGITYMQMANESSTTRGGIPIFSEEQIRKTYTQEDPTLYPNVKWMDEMFRDFSTTQRVNVNVSGGSEFAQFYVSVGYYDESGMYKIDKNQVHDGSINFKRYNFTSNLTMQISKTTEAKLGIKGYSSSRTAPRYGAEEVFKMALNTYPTVYPAGFYPGNELPWKSTGGGLKHPYGMVTQYGFKTTDKDQTYADLRLTQKLDFITKGLSAKGLFSFDNYNSYSVDRTRDPITYYADRRDENGDLILVRTDEKQAGVNYLGFDKSTSGNRRYYLEGSLNYEQMFDNKHRVSGLFLYNQTDYLDKDAGALISAQAYRSLGIAGRATYSYADTYLFEANFGYNGSENFAPKKRFGFFPSVGIGWVLSNEKFYNPIKDYVQFLKVRATWGQSGNDNLGGRRFAYLPTVDGGVNGFTYGYGDSKGTIDKGYNFQYYAVDVTWETSTKQNLGIDLHTLNNNLVIQADFFKDRRKDIFLQRSAVPDFAGVRNQDYGNLGIIDNQGYEFSIDWTKTFGDWRLGLKVNYTFNESKIIEDDTPSKPYPWLETRGRTRYNRSGYICDGFYTEEDINSMKTQSAGNMQIAVPEDFDPSTNNYMAGDLKYRDLNGDFVIDENDMTWIGKDQVPQTTYGFGINAGWKGFSLGAFFQGVTDCDLNTLSEEFIPFTAGSARGNVYADITQRWTPQNQGEGAIYPRLNYGNGKLNKNYASSTFWLKDGSFLRLKTLELGYNIPTAITKKWGVESLRVYFLGYNLLTFTDFDRYDVELGSGSGTQYPNTRTYSVGFNFSF